MPPNAPPKTASAPKRKASQQFNNPGSKRQKMQMARTIHTQRTSSLPKAGVPDSLNLSTFLSTREFEIKAFEDGLKRSKKELMTRAFQSVPREMRRRTASHNVKKVPGRLRERAAREMRDDNTPATIDHKVTSRVRLRRETAKRLEKLAQNKKAGKVKIRESRASEAGEPVGSLVGREPVPKVKKGVLGNPMPNSKFKKRQIHKTWLPTHLWHAKRAKMTEPKSPLWRFAIPLSPTEKSYRPTHRASGARGAVAWDMSYMSTIGLEGTDLALEKVLRCVGVVNESTWGLAGAKWRAGIRTWSGWTSREVNGHRRSIGPTTIIWEAPIVTEQQDVDMDIDGQSSDPPAKNTKVKPQKRHILIRTHPTSFLELWTEVLRISKQQHPIVHIEDLRFGIGSIEITGPSSTEVLLGILHPFKDDGCHEKLLKALGGLTNPASLPQNALLNISVMDPRLRFPPRQIAMPKPDDEEASFKLLEALASWPIDTDQPSRAFFDHRARWDATRLPSQKAINRRQGASPPGEFPTLTPLDPQIPVLLFATRTTKKSAGQGTYTLLAPWKCILPIWYGLMHYPISTGGNARMGGLRELQQISFEQGKPHYPNDYIGTDAGWAHELQERTRRKKEWEARPRGKRTAYESLDLGKGRKGEIGNPWGCDFEILLDAANGITASADDNEVGEGTTSYKTPFQHISETSFRDIVASKEVAGFLAGDVLTVRLTNLSKGTPQACARIYRLPASAPAPLEDSTVHESEISTASANSTNSRTMPADLRQQWLAQLPTTIPKKTKSTIEGYQANGLKRVPVSRPPTLTLEERKRNLAQELLSQPALPYPPVKTESPHAVVPNEEDLIGFVTTANFNLAEGKGTAIGSLMVGRLIDGKWLKSESRERQLCIIRNVGESIGRLARWETV